MADISINIDSGSSKRLLTSGKYCDRNILIMSIDRTLPAICKKDVNFYDYDGTLVASYLLDEISTLSDLPTPLSHTGLTFQGWNYSLTEIKSTERPLDIGATYNTNDGKTRLYINVPRSGEKLYIRINQNMANGVTVDWGDGVRETSSESGNIEFIHTYDQSGDFTISLDPNQGCELGLGWSQNSSCLMGESSNQTRFRSNMLKKVEIGNNVTIIAPYAFYHCYSLTTISIPNSVTTIGTYAFNYCYSLRSVCIPDSITSINNYAFYYCSSLLNVCIPNSVTTIGTYVFGYCYSLRSVCIPDSITSINKYFFTNCYTLSDISLPSVIAILDDRAFYNCYCLSSFSTPADVVTIGMYVFNTCYSLNRICMSDRVVTIGTYAFNHCHGLKEILFFGLTPPTITTTTFNGLPEDCIIYVPRGAASTYKAATNWTSVADRIQEMTI